MPVYTYTTLDDPSANNNTQAFGINASGRIVGQYIDANNHTHGFLYSNGTYTTLDNPSTSDIGVAVAIVVNGLSQIVGSYGDASGEHGFLYNNGSYTTLNDPFANNNTTALGMNDTGQIVGHFNNGLHGFLYSNGTYTTLDDPLGTNGTIAAGINASGQIVGQYKDANNHTHGFLLTITPNPPPPTGTTADMILRHASDGQ